MKHVRMRTITFSLSASLQPDIADSTIYHGALEVDQHSRNETTLEDTATHYNV